MWAYEYKSYTVPTDTRQSYQVSVELELQAVVGARDRIQVLCKSSVSA